MELLRWAYDKKLTPRCALWAFALASFHGAFATALIREQDVYEKSQTFKIVGKVAPLNWWSLGFAVPAIILLVAALSRRLIPWLIGTFFSTVVAVTWVICIVLARLDGAPLTVGGIALWLFFLFANIMAITNPHQIVVTPPALLPPESVA